MLLRKLRYEDLSKEEFLKVIKEYYNTLIKMPFGTKSCLLKYFGHSFFHDGKILEISYIPSKKILNIHISSENIIMPPLVKTRFWNY